MKKILGLLVVGIILIVALTTNPAKDQFITWSEHEMKSQSDVGLVNWGIDEFGGSLLSSVTSEHNYLFFTIYEVKIANVRLVRVLGLFNHFIPLSIGIA